MIDEYERQEFWQNKSTNKITLNKCNCWKCLGLKEDPYTKNDEEEILDAYHKEVNKFYPKKGQIKFTYQIIKFIFII